MQGEKYEVETVRHKEVRRNKRKTIKVWRDIRLRARGRGAEGGKSGNRKPAEQ